MNRALFLGFLTLLISSSIADAGTISGRVIIHDAESLKSDGPKPTVTLTKFDQGSPVELPAFQNKPLSKSRRFSFTVADVGARYAYLVRVNLGDLAFYGQLLRPSKAKPRASTTIEVYPPSTDRSLIDLQKLHIQIQPVAELPGLARVIQTTTFSNHSKRTVVGPGPGAEDQAWPISIPLPEKFEALSVGFEAKDSELRLDSHRIFYNTHFHPGTRELIVEYKIPYSGSQLIFDLPDTFDPVESVSYMLDERLRPLEPAGMTGGNRKFFNETAYRVFHVPLKKGITHISARFDGMPLNLDLLRRTIPISLIVLMILAVFVVRKHRAPRFSRMEENEIEALRMRLLWTAARLEIALQRHAIEVNDYNRQKHALLKQLLSIYHHRESRAA